MLLLYFSLCYLRLLKNNNYLTWTISWGGKKYPPSPPPLVWEYLPYLLWKFLHNLIRWSFPNHHCLRMKITSSHKPHFLWHQMWTQCLLGSLATPLLRTLFIMRKYAAVSQSTTWIPQHNIAFEAHFCEPLKYALLLQRTLTLSCLRDWVDFCTCLNGSNTSVSKLSLPASNLIKIHARYGICT